MYDLAASPVLVSGESKAESGPFLVLEPIESGSEPNFSQQGSAGEN